MRQVAKSRKTVAPTGFVPPDPRLHKLLARMDDIYTIDQRDVATRLVLFAIIVVVRAGLIILGLVIVKWAVAAVLPVGSALVLFALGLALNDLLKKRGRMQYVVGLRRLALDAAQCGGDFTDIERDVSIACESILKG